MQRILKLSRRVYWRLVRQRAWALSKDHFQWTYPFIAAVVSFVLAWLFWDWQQAIDDYLKPGAVGLVTLVIVGTTMYVFNMFRAAADIHAEQSAAIGHMEREHIATIARLERKHATAVAELRQRLDALNEMPDPLRVSFEPGRTPFEERHMVIVGVPLGGLGESPPLSRLRETAQFRIRVDNTSAVDMDGVSVRLTFEGPVQRRNHLPLSLMKDVPDEGDTRRFTFTVPAFYHQFVDVVRSSRTYEDAHAYLCYALPEVEKHLEPGMHHIIITAHGGDKVRPHAARFRIDVSDDGDVFFTPEAADVTT